MNTKEQIAQLLLVVKSKRPVVHHITNYVTVNDCANITLALGASPIMADDISEMKEIVAISGALLLNIGTLNERTVKSMLLAGKEANSIGVPVILDPVGVGASSLRREAVEQICKEIKLAVVRGNSSEILFMAGQDVACRGVDAAKGIANNQSAQFLAMKLDCIVAMTGDIDEITDGKQTIYINNGNALMESVTGTGCMCTSLVSSFCAVSKNYLLATAAGVLCMSLAGDLAYSVAAPAGTSSYREAIIDEISNMNCEKIMQSLIEER